jgi:1-deoxy-D-xylulose-5-phosphate reductoisomerase
MRRVSIFGATGSIGQNTLDLLRRDPTAYQVVALSGGRNIAQLAKDALEFSPEVVVTAFADLLPELQAAMAGSGVAVEAGAEAIARAAERPGRLDHVMYCGRGGANAQFTCGAARHDLGPGQ